tara:strand:- start:106 stop:1113 length:1008 start_codon:yes stop_codon:yes gene_type:complete
MGFLDNSGDIILDAVLTDLGRKRMAEGEFRIVKFSFGDDEIDYSLYNANHPSGSAYYDLEILQSPVMEAATRLPSSIKYGLMSVTNNNLTYMPVAKVNQKTENSLVKTNGIYYLAVNAKTHQNLLDNNANSSNKFLEPNSKSPSKVLIVETGLDTDQRTATLENRNAAIVQTGLLDLNFEVKFDNRFVAGVMSLVGGRFANTSDDTSDVALNNFASRSARSSLDFIENYSTAMVSGIANEVAKRSTTAEGKNISEFEGPRGSVTAMTFSPSLEINAEGTASPTYYTLYGKTSVAASAISLGGSSNYDYIDTTVYVQGMASGTQLQIPLRLIRLRG